MMENAFTPDWIDTVGNNDNIIESIAVSKNTLHMTVHRWDAGKIELVFSDYYGMRDICSVSAEIGEIKTRDTSPFLAAFAENGFTPEDLRGVKSYSFCDPWDGHVMLEILAKNVTVKQR